MTTAHFGLWRELFAGVALPVPVAGGGSVRGVNFDNAASTPPLKRVRDAVNGCCEVYSSVHRGTGYKSRLATEAYEHARELVAHFLGVDERAQVVIFVKGTTDALNRIAAEQARLDGRQVLVTEMEHHADRSEEHTSELQSHLNLVCRLLLEKKKKTIHMHHRTISHA